MNSPKAYYTSKKLGFCQALHPAKTLKFQMLMEWLTKRPRILDQTTQELYIPGHQACLWLGALSTPGGGSKSKEKRLFTEGNLSCG
jgi:hypothetical protein